MPSFHFIVVAWLWRCIPFLLPTTGVLHLQINTPTYCIDPQILLITNTRAEKCFTSGSSSHELQYLRGTSVANYHRAQELLAFQYFVEYKANPFRRPCANADFEYIPLLPLAWRSGIPTSTTCTAGGYCPKKNVTGDVDACSVRGLIDDIVNIVKYIKNDRKQTDLTLGIPKFTVASTYNLRTFMAFGLPNSARSGAIYAAVTAFVTGIHRTLLYSSLQFAHLLSKPLTLIVTYPILGTMIGHYERQPQCPDTLRKQWRLLVEIPFLSLLDPASELSNGLLVEGSHNADLRVQKDNAMKKKNVFLFTGRLLLWLPDRVCAIRSTVSVLQRYYTGYHLDYPHLHFQTVTHVTHYPLTPPNPSSHTFTYPLTSAHIFCKHIYFPSLQSYRHRCGQHH